VLLTRSPLIGSPKRASPFDLHVLSTPPAFVLSQDQTLHQCFEMLEHINRKDPGNNKMSLPKELTNSHPRTRMRADEDYQQLASTKHVVEFSNITPT
jgi:hypothetical protein